MFDGERCEVMGSKWNQNLKNPFFFIFTVGLWWKMAWAVSLLHADVCTYIVLLSESIWWTCERRSFKKSRKVTKNNTSAPTPLYPAPCTSPAYLTPFSAPPTHCIDELISSFFTFHQIRTYSALAHLLHLLTHTYSPFYSPTHSANSSIYPFIAFIYTTIINNTIRNLSHTIILLSSKWHPRTAPTLLSAQHQAITAAIILSHKVDI